MFEYLILLLLPLASFSGWLIGRRAFSAQAVKNFLGMSKLMRSKPHQAVEVLTDLVESNQEVVDTHLALGGAFRRSGEVDKAVGIHQNLIKRDSLTAEQRAVSLLELSQDYMRAGMLDRAENVLLDLVEQGNQLNTGYRLLLDIYQQSKDWSRAIQVAEMWQTKTKKNTSYHVAHFYCELAEQEWLKAGRAEAHGHLTIALRVNPACVRASILLGNMQTQSGAYQEAIQSYKRVQKQDKDFLSEIVLPLARCYEKLDDPDGMMHYFDDCLRNYLTTPTILAFSEWLHQIKGEEEAVQFVTQYLKKTPSLRGLNRLVQLSIERSQGTAQQDLQLFQELIDSMLVNKPLYQCEACGFSGRVLQWQCPSCKRWDVIKPIHEK